MRFPGTSTSSSDPYYGVEEKIVSTPVPQLIGTALSLNLGILVSRGNPSSYIWAASNGNIISVLPGWQPYPVLGQNGHGSKTHVN